MHSWLSSKVNEFSQRYHIDLAYVIKSEFWIYLGQGVLLITGLATSVAWARLASQEVLGQYSFAFAVLSVVYLASLPGLNNAVLRSVARGNEGSYPSAVRTSFLWSTIGIPVLLGIGSYYYFSGSPMLGMALMISSILFPFFYAPAIWGGFLSGKRRFDLAAKYRSTQSLISSAAVITILFLNPSNLVIILITHMAVNSALNIFFYRRSLRYMENRAEDIECKRYGFFLTAASAAGVLAQNIDRILIGILLDAPQLAVYAIALLIPQKLRELLKYAWVPFTPKFSRDGIEMQHVTEKVKRLVLPLTLLGLGGSLLYWFFIDEVMLLFFSDKYAESISFSRVLLLLIWVSVPASFFGQFTTAKKKRKAIALGLYVSPFLRLVIMAIFIYLWGITGAVWALIIATAFQSLLFWLGMRGEEIVQEQIGT